MQRFYADPKQTFEFANGAIGFRPTGTMDCLGPFAKVKNCPVEGETRRYTVYAQSYADTYFSIPAATRIRGKIVKGFITASGDDNKGITFYPYKGGS
jgi:hypothetical protein